jgi:hypothetical protein
MVSAGAQTFGPFEATSAASFDPVTIPFKVVGTEAQMLIFYGESLVFVANQEDHVAYIDAVSIKPVVPKILSGPSDIDPDSAILLSGENFGLPTGQIKVAFRNASVEPFSNGDGSKTEFHLKTVGSDTFAESDTPIDVAHPQGAVDGQTVDITIATAAGFQSSNVWRARFHNKAVITSGPGTITPGQSFILRGWDFDSKAECSSEKRGTVTVRFSDKSYKSFPNQGPSNASDTDLVIPILGSGCLSDSIKVRLPADTAGVVAQAVQIIYESPGGRKSNPWPAQFAPKLETIAFPWQLVGVNCSDQSAHDACNIPDDSTDSECGWFDGLGSDWPDTSIVAVHVGCWGLDSDNGTDAYVTMVSSSRGWSMSTGVSVSPAVANASYSTNAVPIAFATTSGLVFNVNWHIGAEGGAIWYGGPIYITGPVGVPYQ